MAGLYTTFTKTKDHYKVSLPKNEKQYLKLNLK